MDLLAIAIVDRRKRLAALDAQVLAVRSELEALLKAAAIVGTVVPDENDTAKDDGEISRRRGGKPPGAISNRWRAVLALLLPEDARHSAAHVAQMALQSGIKIDPGAIRDRIRHFVDVGHLIKHGDGTFSVSPDAVLRFNLMNFDYTSAPPDEEGADT